MKTKIINGELVYILEPPGLIPCDKSLHYSEVQIIRHRDLIRMLNKLFEDVENMDAGSGHHMWEVLNIFAGGYAGNWRIPIKIRDKEAVGFDDPIKKKKEPRLHTGARIASFRNKRKEIREIGIFKVYCGGR